MVCVPGITVLREKMEIGAAIIIGGEDVHTPDTTLCYAMRDSRHNNASDPSHTLSLS